ncbi:MAG: hypothetical protein QG597_4674 [Actinomycetota bacterium]|nr:hypothetical protein [Actinomycetota bacterium]
MAATTPNGSPGSHAPSPAPSTRFRLNRAGILNVWQYDSQEFDFGGGRLLLRGANGAGKSKTLEMLLPFALDGDKARLTASAKHHTSLLWLMTDGYDGPGRVGYIWVEFLRPTVDGGHEAFTCGVGIRASGSQRTATAWHFTTDQRIGIDFTLDDDGSPLTRGRLAEVLGDDGYVFERATAYKEHVGRALFGLDPAQYDDVLRLLYWLRQPQIGEDIEPAKLTGQLSQALPQLDEQALRAAGETFDELTAFGEQIERRAAAAGVLTALAGAYADYARAVVADRARAVANALRTERQLRTQAKRAQGEVERLGTELAAAEAQRAAEAAAKGQEEARLTALQDSPEFRTQRRLTELRETARRDRRQADVAATRRADAAGAVSTREGKVAERAAGVRRLLQSHVALVRGLHARLREGVPGSAGLVVGSALEGPRLESTDEVESLIAALDHAVVLLGQARTAVSLRLAAVAVVRVAAERAEAADRTQQAAERAADEAEQRWDAARNLLREAERAADDALRVLDEALVAWVAEPVAVAVELPEELDADAVARLPELAQDAAAPTLDAMRSERAQAAARREAAGARIAELGQRRAEVAAERDPAPPPPALPRTERPDGLPLWQVVDFTRGLDGAQQAGLEAALQAAGLLDAWVRPGGRLLDEQQRDVVLAPARSALGDPHAAGSTGTSGGPDTPALDRLLTPDLPADARGLHLDDVRAVLAAIGTEDHRATAWVRPDGMWRLGPAHGRAAKEAAQFIGATARAQERLRRLAEIDAELAEQRTLRTAADSDHERLTAEVAALTAWVRAVPSGRALLTAWTRADERRRAEAEAGEVNRTAQVEARSARAAAADARTRLQRAADEHALPSATSELNAVDQALRGLDSDLNGAERDVPPIRSGITAWTEATAFWQEALDTLAAEQSAAAEADRQARESGAQADALEATMGASIQQLQQAIGEAQRNRDQHERAAEAAQTRANALRGEHGEAKAEARNADARLAEHLGQRTGTIGALAATSGVPGLLAATAAPEADGDEVLRLVDHPAGEAVSRRTAEAVQSLARLSEVEPSTAVNRVWKSHAEATSGPAADHQPAVAQFDDLLAVSGTDEAGEAPIVELATRVDAAVRRDRELLTEREKKQFEQHILGELGDAIRRCRREADELVIAMNQQLAHVTTSQGIQVKLEWKLRADVPAEAREAVGLLSQPVGALVASERARLRDVLHELIEVSRSERPELSYGEHLSAALDYRVWSEFTIRYSRPEGEGAWERLHRRSPLSQGEQKVLCYLPLFAAAAAHFTSLAGAAPYAPRLVLLDDAFPKIDVRTHPLLFGLLVQLDLDFVITSERLWGDHDTVPSLAIYEALRDPSQRGIAQYEYRWDGRSLHALG